jgi:oligopeptide transport system ATP-binding protein
MSEAALLSVRDLKVHFPVRIGGLFGKMVPVKAVDGVSFDLHPGETLGVVGESGCGKSTLGRAILRLIPPSDGAVIWLGERLDSLSHGAMRAKREDMQIIFQDPLASLDPRMTIGDVIAEPLRTFQPKLSRKEVRARVEDMLAKVGLSPHMINRYPHEFSGGQCQRVGVARAMILRPRLIVCDEPVSALDVSIQAQIVNLLMDLQREFNLSLIFISHNLSVVRHISHRILVLYLGRVMELADRDQLYRNPRHPYTQALVSAVPIPDPDLERQKERLVLTGDLPSPLAPPSGCVFRTRCPYATAICAEDIPPLDLIEPGHQAACHWWRAIAAGEKERTGPFGEVKVAVDGTHPAPGAPPART